MELPKIFALGETSTSGTYILMLQFYKSIKLIIGKFNSGQPIFFPPGNYIYIGSALATKGSASLPNRLLRHTTRTASYHHPIRQSLLSYFQSEKIPTHVPNSKKLHWNIDYILEQEEVNLEHILIIQYNKPLESKLAEFITNRLSTEIIVAGLGANDKKQSTHFLKIDTFHKFVEEIKIYLEKLLIDYYD